MPRFHTHEWDMLPEMAFRPRPGGGMTLEGGKGGDMPAPDPELIKAQIKSMGIQDSAIERIMANAESIAPLQQEQMRFGIDANRTALKNSQADREYSLERRAALSGLQDRLISDASTFNTEAKQDELAGQASADVQQAFDSQRESSARGMARMGVNPNSGRALALNNQMDMAQAMAKAGASTVARTAARTEGRAMTDRATNALAGYPAMGMQATGQGAQMAAGGINIANSGLQGLNSGLTTGAQVAGQMGQNATSMWGQQANAYNQSQANAGEGFGAILGAGAKLGAAYLGASDRRLKTNISQVGVDERTGLNLYEFEYIDGSGQRYEGVMADEVERVMPEAVFEMPDGFKAVNYQMLGIEMKEVA